MGDFYLAREVFESIKNDESLDVIAHPLGLADDIASGRYSTDQELVYDGLMRVKEQFFCGYGTDEIREQNDRTIDLVKAEHARRLREDKAVVAGMLRANPGAVILRRDTGLVLVHKIVETNIHTKLRSLELRGAKPLVGQKPFELWCDTSILRKNFTLPDFD